MEMANIERYPGHSTQKPSRPLIAVHGKASSWTPKFKRLTGKAGCEGYAVWIAGRLVTYYGRKGEVHI